MLPPPCGIHNFRYKASIEHANEKVKYKMSNISKGSCVSQEGGGAMFHWPWTASNKKVTTRLNSICLTIWNRRALIIYSAVLNLVTNQGTRILFLIGFIVWFCFLDKFVFFVLYYTFTEILAFIKT